MKGKLLPTAGGFPAGVARGVGVALMILVLAALPQMVKSAYYLSIMVVIGIHTIVVVGLGLLMGYAGQVSLGHAGFYGIGAYVSGILTATYGYSPWIAMVVAAVVTAVVAYVVGVPTLQLRGHYLALGTLGLGIIIYKVFTEADRYTGGYSGLPDIPYLSIAGVKLIKDAQYYYVVWIVAVMCMIVAYNIVHSRVGRALRAIHGSEVAAEAMGVDTARYKLQVFVLSAVYASLAGSLYAHWVTFISPSVFSFMPSIVFVVMAVVGGLTSVWGPVVGVGLVTILVEVLRDVTPRVLPKTTGEVEIVLFGLILVLVMILMPEGLTVTLYNAYGRLRDRAGASACRRSRRDTGMDGGVAAPGLQINSPVGGAKADNRGQTP